LSQYFLHRLVIFTSCYLAAVMSIDWVQGVPIHYPQLVGSLLHIGYDANFELSNCHWRGYVRWWF
jgi:hypothetical protein